MPQVSFNYCALHYLNLWFRQEKRYCDALETISASNRLEALRDAAITFGVARNLPDAHAVGSGVAKYAPVLSEIDRVDPETLQGAGLVPAIRNVEKLISARFGGATVTSFTTKMLWLRFKSPIIIYDRNARTALELKLKKGRELEDFYIAWQTGYDIHAAQIDVACDELPSAVRYCVNKSVTTEHIQTFANQRWFKARVYDIYLWHSGGS